METMTDKEQLWYDRVVKYLETYDEEYLCSWWLRLEFEHEEKSLTTPKINYILSKLVDKGLLEKETNKSYTRFSLIK